MDTVVSGTGASLLGHPWYLSGCYRQVAAINSGFYKQVVLIDRWLLWTGGSHRLVVLIDWWFS